MKKCAQCCIAKDEKHDFGRGGKDELCRVCKFGPHPIANTHGTYPSGRDERWAASGRGGSMGKGWDA